MRRSIFKISIISFLVLPFFIGAMPKIALSQNAPSDSTDSQRSMVRRIMERFGFKANWANCGYSIAVDQNGRIVGLNGIPYQSDSTLGGSEWAYRFLESNRDIFGIENPRQELPLSFEDHRIIRMHQVVNGVNVLNSYVKFGLNIDASSAFIDFSCFPEARNIDTTPSIVASQAQQIAMADPAHEGKRVVADKPNLLIVNFPDGLHLVWQVGVVGGGYGGSAVYMIDAHTGEILDARTALI